MASFLPILTAGLAAAVLFLGLRLASVQHSAASLADQLETLCDLSSNSLIRLSGNAPLRNAAETMNMALRRLRAEKLRLEQGDNALRRALAGWSHDLRTPLTAVSGYISLLRREPQTDKASEYLAVITRRLAMLEDILEDLFSFSFALSEADSLSLAPADLRAELEKSAALFYDSLAERGIVPDLDFPAEPVRVNVNARALVRILNNLWSNAAKYAKNLLHVTLRADGVLVFSNDTDSFDPVRLDMLLGQNRSVPYAGEYAGGMGLSAAKMLCEKMGGTFTAEYADGILSVSAAFPPAPGSEDS